MSSSQTPIEQRKLELSEYIVKMKRITAKYCTDIAETPFEIQLAEDLLVAQKALEEIKTSATYNAQVSLNADDKEGFNRIKKRANSALNKLTQSSNDKPTAVSNAQSNVSSKGEK